MTEREAPGVTVDVPFEVATDVTSIRYRLHPIDVGFDLREDDTSVAIDAAEEAIRVSYPDRNGDRRVMSGPRSAVLARLRKLGFRFAIG